MGRALGGVFSEVTGPAGFPRARERREPWPSGWVRAATEVLDIECAAAVVDTFGVQEPARLWLLAASSERAS